MTSSPEANVEKQAMPPVGEPGGPPVPDPYDMGLLRDDASRIKQSLYAEYGETIRAMLEAEQAARQGSSEGNPSQVETWQQQIDELIKYQKPLRQQIKKCQDEAISKLVEAATEDQRRGINVSDKLSLLLSMQK